MAGAAIRVPDVVAGTELVVVRHGRGLCNEAGVIGGRLGCAGLGDAGREQSRLLAVRLAAMAVRRPFDVVISSPRLRVIESAEVVGAELGMPVVVHDGLAGQEFGEADGRRWDDVTAAFGGPPTHDPDRPIAPGAEPWNAYATRVLTALAEVLTWWSGGRILVIAHGRTSALAASLLSGAPDPGVPATAATVAHGDLTTWHRSPTGWEQLQV